MRDVNKALDAADSLAHKCAEIAGQLDTAGAINLPNLVALCQSCKEQLLSAAGDYWALDETSGESIPESSGLVTGQFDLNLDKEQKDDH